MRTSTAPEILEENLRDPSYPVHRIADELLPYLQILIDQFHPERVVLFGSYAYGTPTEHSDVDLLVVKDMEKSSVSELRDILKAWRPLRWSTRSLPFELLVVSPAEHEQRIARGGGFYGSIIRDGLTLVA